MNNNIRDKLIPRIAANLTRYTHLMDQQTHTDAHYTKDTIISSIAQARKEITSQNPQSKTRFHYHLTIIDSLVSETLMYILDKHLGLPIHKDSYINAYIIDLYRSLYQSLQIESNFTSLYKL